MVMDIQSIREQIPSLKGDSPIYLDNACVTLRPQSVIDAVTRYYEQEPSCGGRSAHRWGMAVTRTEHAARDGIARLVGAQGPDEVVFTRNATHSINAVAHGTSWEKGDVVVITDKEHNSNSIPWKMQDGVDVRVTRTGEDGRFDLEDFEAICADVGNSLRMVAIGHTRNLDGTSTPAKECAKIAHDYGAQILLDAAQSVPHQAVDMKDIGADFLAFSIHKMMGPSGMGTLVASEEAFNGLQSIAAGGQTVSRSTHDDYVFKPGRGHLEGGLGHYAGYYGTAAAVDFLNGLSMQKIYEHEVKINRIISEGVRNLDGASIIGPDDPAERGGITSILLEGRDPHQIAILLDEGFGIYARSGLHCVDPWFHANDALNGSLRFSAYAYNTIEEAKQTVDAMDELFAAIPRT